MKSNLIFKNTKFIIKLIMLKKNFKTIFLLIVLLAFILRFYDLGFKVYNWDEAVHAWITRSLVETGEYSYSPVYHGPMGFYFTAFLNNLFGYSEFVGRILPILAGTLLIVSLYLLRNFIGEKAVLISAFLFTISPTFLYYSRFFRNDIYIALFSLVIFVTGLMFLKTRENKYLILSAISLGLSLSSKENSLINGFIFVSFFVIYFGFQYYNKKINFSKILKNNFQAILLFSGISFLVVTMFYTNFFADFDGLTKSLNSGFEYWFNQHKEEKFGGPFYFYLGRMILYELPILIFGSLGILYFYKHKKNKTMNLFLIYWTISSFLIYSYFEEKMPQVLLNIILPMGILASMYISQKIDIKKLTSFILIISVVLTIFSGIRAVYINPDDSREPIMYAQTKQQIRDFSNLIKENFNENSKLQVLHPVDEGLSSPVYWYLWEFPKENIGEDIEKVTEPIVISLLWNNYEINQKMKEKGYSEKRFYTWGNVEHDENFFNYLNPEFYFFRKIKGNVGEQGIMYLFILKPKVEYITEDLGLSVDVFGKFPALFGYSIEANKSI